MKGLKTLNEIASDHNLHPNQVSRWKKQLLTEGPTVFSSNAVEQLEDVAEDITESCGWQEEKRWRILTGDET